MIIFLTHPFLGGDISEYDTRGSVQELIAVQQIAPVGFFLHFLFEAGRRRNVAVLVVKVVVPAAKINFGLIEIKNVFVILLLEHENLIMLNG